MTRPGELARAFRGLFPDDAPGFFFAPGRVNLIGEHTDYNEGFVLPMALEQGTLVAAAPRNDRHVRVHSLNAGDTLEFDLDRPGTKQRGIWLDYVEGVARILDETGGPERPRTHGVPTSAPAGGGRLTGANLAIASDVPLGAGLSSSAALEISTGLAFLTLSGRAGRGRLDRRALAEAGREAEWTWAGVHCGIMDQFAAVFGRKGHALLIDCRSFDVTPIPFGGSDVALILVDSQVGHELAGSEYNTRRAECRAAVELIAAAHPEWRVTALRDVTPERLAAVDLPPRLARRALHVVSENERTRAAARALQAGEWDALGRAMFESHASLRNNYEVSSPALDFLVETARAIPGVLGARLTGGGFGGCTVNLVERRRLAAFTVAMSDAWRRNFDTAAVFHPAEAGDGATQLTVDPAEAGDGATQLSVDPAADQGAAPLSPKETRC